MTYYHCYFIKLFYENFFLKKGKCSNLKSREVI